MSDGTSIDMAEVIDLAVSLSAAGESARAATESRVLTVVARNTRDSARSTVPVASGELRNSIYIRGGLGYRIIGTDVDHGFYQEFGTSEMGPQPWLLQHAEKAQREMTELLLKDVAGPLP